MSPSLMFPWMASIVDCAFFVFQSSVSIDQKIIGIVRVLFTSSDAMPPGRRASVGVTPVSSWTF